MCFSLEFRTKEKSVLINNLIHRPNELTLLRHQKNLIELDALTIRDEENAEKYNTEENKKIAIKTIKTKEGWQLIVEDNGSGMTMETQKHIFDKFYRQRKNLNGEVKGLGLGLYYVKQAADAHEWVISLKSTSNEGSIFTISNIK